MPDDHEDVERYLRRLINEELDRRNDEFYKRNGIEETS
jgi:hypothetical protein